MKGLAQSSSAQLPTRANCEEKALVGIEAMQRMMITGDWRGEAAGVSGGLNFPESNRLQLRTVPLPHLRCHHLLYYECL